MKEETFIYKNRNQSAKDQQITNSDILQTIIDLPKEVRLNYFWEVHNQMTDNLYWLALATIWMDTPVCSPNFEFWETLFRSPKRNRHKLMKKSDRKTWRKLPETVIAYRAINDPKEIETAISWTLDKSVAEKLADGREVVSKRIQKSSIIAYFDRRHEKEIIVLN